jgi:hypothetical protein
MGHRVLSILTNHDGALYVVYAHPKHRFLRLALRHHASDTHRLVVGWQSSASNAAALKRKLQGTLRYYIGHPQSRSSHYYAMRLIKWYTLEFGPGKTYLEEPTQARVMVLVPCLQSARKDAWVATTGGSSCTMPMAWSVADVSHVMSPQVQSGGRRSCCPSALRKQKFDAALQK